MDGWMDGWMDGRTDGRMDGWMDGLSELVSCLPLGEWLVSSRSFCVIWRSRLFICISTFDLVSGTKAFVRFS